MWRNTEVLAWLEWLRARNASVPEPSVQVGFFGLDLYSLRESMSAVLHYLDRVDPAAAERARARYGCFDELAHDPQAYGWNLRDRHMADTLDELDRHLTTQRGRPARIVVWAHNSHIGDARATDSARRGQWNLGQLVREAHAGPRETFFCWASRRTPGASPRPRTGTHRWSSRPCGLRGPTASSA
jgi:erythromycin esterase-like protein